MVVFAKLTGLWALAALAALGQLASVSGFPTQKNADNTPSEENNTTTSRQFPPGSIPKPLYAIAHRVLTSKGVKDALEMGANAIEIDMQPWKRSGWWADHDGLAASAGDKAKDIFATIASERKKGKSVGFVWLDIKGPDHCSPDHPRCSFAVLRNLAREILEPEGIHVLYGFYGANGDAYKSIQGDLNDLEAVNVNGEASEVKDAFAKYGPTDVNKRTMAYGYYNLAFQFGNCQEKSYNTCTELRQGAESKKDIGKVYGWTNAVGQSDYVNKLLDVGVDGLIFGFKATHFYDHASTRSAFADIKNWVDAHPQFRYLATVNDKPWAPSRWV